MLLPKYRVALTENEKAELERLIRKHSTAQNLVKRARIILLANGQGQSNKEIAGEVGMSKCDVTRWTKRRRERKTVSVEARLGDASRSGRPDRMSAEQWCQIPALACESPQDHELPITHWTHKEWAREVVKQGIVDRISPSPVGAILKKRVATASLPLLVERKSR